jgi:hypothetical protein
MPKQKPKIKPMAAAIALADLILSDGAILPGCSFDGFDLDAARPCLREAIQTAKSRAAILDLVEVKWTSWKR